MIRYLSLSGLLAALMGCGGGLDSEDALRQHGYSETYVAGFHQGCPSGNKAGGDFLSEARRDDEAYRTQPDYRTGWDYGFVTCKAEFEQELEIAKAVGAGIAGYGTNTGTDGVDVNKVMSQVDTSKVTAAIKAAGW